MAAQGYRFIAGVDEAGRGPLAGPVVAAAVIIPLNLDLTTLAGVRDSKLLKPRQRELLYDRIQETAISIGVGIIDNQTIDGQGIIKATRLAMKTAVEQLTTPPESLLIDYLRLPELPYPQKGIKFGDRVCFSIACASIIAKVTRDRIMQELDRIHPGYRLARHKGYGTAEHLACLRRLGPSPVHRRSFKPVKDLIHEP
jgi:ribonuclease HII